MGLMSCQDTADLQIQTSQGEWVEWTPYGAQSTRWTLVGAASTSGRLRVAACPDLSLLTVPIEDLTRGGCVSILWVKF